MLLNLKSSSGKVQYKLGLARKARKAPRRRISPQMSVLAKSIMPAWKSRDVADLERSESLRSWTN
jgi:hypothetical protein